MPLTFPVLVSYLLCRPQQASVDEMDTAAFNTRARIQRERHEHLRLESRSLADPKVQQGTSFFSLFPNIAAIIISLPVFAFLLHLSL